MGVLYASCGCGVEVTEEESHCPVCNDPIVGVVIGAALKGRGGRMAR